MSFSDQYFYKKLEINEIIEQLKSYASLEYTKKYFSKMKTLNDIDVIKEELSKTNEAFTITTKYDRCPIYIDCQYDKLLDVAVKGGILSGKELFETVKLFSTIRANERLLNTLEKEKVECKYYKNYVTSLYICVELEKVLRKSLDDNGDILD